ncbi:MAG: tetratricopeptide repeat protein, partial [Candidatus Hydrogenedentes bacterium]|nr:tetratricopeptide repeat protein [Candidatus Hydrogenedentota bacterium]
VYITENPYVSHGVTWDGIAAAFTKPLNGGWNPVATLTHMIDVDIFGLDPGPPHVINVIFHCSNTVVLFLLLFTMTRARWPSAFVAALFALHPLHVEPVAWLSSRKDVLSMHFMLMTIRLYLRYLEKPNWRTSGLVVVHFLAALLSKPMVVTLPVLLLLLDYWPLGRLDATPVLAEKKRVALRLVREKIPLFLCSIVVSAITVWVQRAGGAVHSFAEYSWYERVGTALVSYLTYVWVTLWPVNLAPHYPHPGALPVWLVIGAAALLLAIAAAALFRMGKSPYLMTGWGWWLVSLFPVIGLVPIGSFARADRFTYMPHIGLFIVFAWGIDELTRRLPQRTLVLTACAVVLFVPMAFATFHQTAHWRESIALFEHAVAVSPESSVARNNLGVALMQRADSPGAQEGDLELAEQHLREAIAVAPASVDAHNNLGIALLLQGEDEAAAAQFEQALELNPDDPDALINAANAQLAQGDAEAAIEMYRRAIAATPFNVKAHYNLGVALAQSGDLEDAVASYREAVALQPDDASLHASLANGLLQQGKYPEAATEALEAVKRDPDDAFAHYNLGMAQYLMNRIDEAIASFRRAVALEPDFLDAHLNLAGAFTHAKQWDEAKRHFEAALRIDPGNPQAAESLQAIADMAAQDAEGQSPKEGS